MEKKDDSLPVQEEAEAFETVEKYNVIQTEVESEKMAMEKKDDSLPVQEEAEAFE